LANALINTIPTASASLVVAGKTGLAVAGAETVAAGAAILGAAATMDAFAGAVRDWVDDGLHGNDSKSTRPTVGYSLRDRESGEVMKIGQTSRPNGRYSQRYLDNKNVDFVPEASGTKSEMLEWERTSIADYKATHGGKRPPMNKVDRE
jgi:hypothetical protein